MILCLFLLETIFDLVELYLIILLESVNFVPYCQKLLLGVQLLVHCHSLILHGALICFRLSIELL